MLFSVNPISQHARAIKSNNPSRFQHHIFTSCRIPSPPFPFFFDTKLAETTDKDILTGFKGSLYNLQQRFDYFGRLMLWIAVLFCNRFNDFGLRDGHK
jgi:hypothetical protein